MSSQETELRIVAKNMTQAAFAQAVRNLKELGAAADNVGRQQFGSLGGAIADVAGSLTSLGGAFGGLAVGKVFSDFLELTGSLADAADKTDLTIRQLQRFSYAGDTVGVAMDDITRAVGKMEENLGGENEGTIGALGKLGLSFDDLRAMNPGDQFETIASKLAGVKDPAERARRAVDIFGKSGMELMPLLRQDLKAVGDEAERVGAVLSDDVVKSGDDLGDLWSKLKASSRSLVAEGLRPVLTAMKQINDPAELARWQELKDVLHVQDAVASWQNLARGVQSVIDLQRGLTATMTVKDIASDAAVRKLFDPKSYAIQLPKLSPKDLNDLYAALDRERDEFNQANKAADEHATAIKKLAASYQGLDKIDAAKNAIEGLRVAMRSGFSVSEMTTESARALNKVMLDAIDTYQHAGRAVPEAWVHIAEQTTIASMQGVADITALIQAVSDFKKITLEIPAAPIPSLSVTKGLPGMPGTDVGRPTIPKLSVFTQMFGSSEDFSQQLSSTILGALQGGGSPITAAAGSVGKQVGTSFASSLTHEGGPLFKTALGGVINSALPVVGSLVGPLASSLWNHFFGTAGRDAVLQFANSQGGFDALQAKLAELDAAGGHVGADLWKSLTQGTGRNNAEQAKQAIQSVMDALGKIPPTMAAQATQAGFQTVQQLQQTAREAEKLWEYMRDSGSYSADAVQQAWQKAQDAIAAAGDEQTSKIQQQLDVAKTALKTLDDEIVSLQKSIENEAPEEVMGVVEAQARARLDALQKERDMAAKHVEEVQGQLTKAMEDVATALKDLPTELDFHIRTHYDDAGGSSSSGKPSHASGAYIREDHTANVHRGEMIGHEDFFGRAFARGLAASGGAGGGDIHVTLQMDGEVVTRQVVRRMGDQVRRYGIQRL